MSREPAHDPDAGDLLSQFRDGDALAFDALVGAFERRLVQFFYRLCWDRARAEDLTQNLFLKLLRHAGRYQPEGKLATFIFRVATNLWIDHYRAERPRQRLFSLDQATLGDERPPGVEPPARPDELPYAEISRILEIPVGTVKSRMHNSVRALREMLNPEGQEDRQTHGGSGTASFRTGGTA